MKNAITLRPIIPNDISVEDMNFLRQVYGSTRADELALTQWDQAQKDAFVQMQFTAQHQYYLQHYQGAEYYVIEVDDQPAGRLYLHRRAGEIRIMDIALLPPYRQRGVGSGLLQELLEEGQRSQREVTIHVERFNPALNLYQRLGFKVLEDRGVYYFLGWSPRASTEKE